MSKVIQNHHIAYKNPDHKSVKEIIVPIYKGEHNLLTKISWYCKKDVSKGFIQALEIFIAMRKYDAIDLDSIDLKEEE